MSTFPRTGLTGVSPADLSWLTGSWEGRNGDDPVEEHWSPPQGDTLMGMFRWVKDGKVFFYELIAIERDDAVVKMRIKHFHRGLVGWEEKERAHEFVLVHLQNREAVFIDLDEPNTRWAVYRLETPDRLVSYFTRENEPVTREGLFAYARRPSRERTNPARIEVSAIDHVYVTVSDLGRSAAFYDAVMQLLGFRKGTTPISGEPHLHYFNPITQYTIRPAKAAAAHDPYRPGLHHLCWRVEEPRIVDAVWEGLRALGIEASPPKLYPEYADDYYATFFHDPDGIRLEVVSLRRLRRLVREHWDELTEFENPLSKAGLL